MAERGRSGPGAHRGAHGPGGAGGGTPTGGVALLGTRPRQVIFTSGATEAINAAVYGAVALARQRSQERELSKAAGGGQGPSASDVGPGPGHLRVALAAVGRSAVRDASEREARRCAAGEQPGAVLAGPGASEWSEPESVALESADSSRRGWPG